MKYFTTIILVACNFFAYSQPTTPVLLIETGLHEEKCYKISTDAAGKYLLTCSRDKTARLWDAATGKLLNIFRIPIGSKTEGRLYASALSADSKIAALGGDTGEEWDSTYCIYLVNTQTGMIIHRVTGLPEVISDLKFSPDGKWLAVGLKEGNGVRIFDTGDWKEYKKLSGCTSDIMDMAFKPGGGFATACYDGKLSVYDNRFELITTKSDLTGKLIYSISFDPTGKLLAIGYDDVTAVEVRNAADLSLLYSPSVAGAESLKYGFDQVCFSADGSILYAGGTFGDTANDKSIVRSWKDGGRGSHTDLAVMRNSVMDMKALPNGSIAVLGYTPDIAVINSSNAINWHLISSKLKLNQHDRSDFKINDKGSSISFTAVGKDAYGFDVPLRKLLQESSTYTSPVTDLSGIMVTNWRSNNSPAINGKKITFLTESETCRSADINSNGKQIVLGTTRHLYLSDANANKIWENSTGQSAWAVNISGNDKVVTAAMDDGTIRWYNMADGKELLAFYLHDDMKRWVLFTPSGYYDASAGAEDFLGWHVNNGPDKTPSFYPVSRFREKFYRPDIIDLIFETFNEKEAIALANKRKGIKENGTAINDISKKPPPLVSIISPSSGTAVSSSLISISFSINTPSDAPAKDIKVLVNGRPVHIEGEIKKDASGAQKIDVKIPKEDCTITLLAENANGTSPEANLLLKWKPLEIEDMKDPVVSKPNLYILAIGISDYNKPEYKLGLAAKDAGDFSAAMTKQKGGLYKEIDIKTLTEKEATKVNIIDGLQWIQDKTTKNDMAMIFFAGHGKNDKNGFYYMLPVDADKDRLRSTCIDFIEVKKTQSTIEGKVIIFIDACHSGGLAGEAETDINGLINLLTSNIKGAGTITFSSSTSKELSFEDISWGNGAFTKALIEGLNGAALQEGEKEISYIDLAAYIARRVKRLTADKQHPTFVPTPNTPDFPIAAKH